MEKLVHCAKCQKPFDAVGEGTKREIAQRVICPYCIEPNEVMWPMDGSVASRGIQHYLEAEELLHRTQNKAAGRITTQPNEVERQDLARQAENFLQGAVGPEDGLIAPVDPSDLKNLWKKQREWVAAAKARAFLEV